MTVNISIRLGDGRDRTDRGTGRANDNRDILDVPSIVSNTLFRLQFWLQLKSLHDAQNCERDKAYPNHEFRMKLYQQYLFGSTRQRPHFF